MASKGPRSKLDHDTRTRRQKALEAPREPRRPKTHWDHVLEEMVWLSKDFESERKWKLAQAKKVAIRASKSLLDHATRGEKKVKEEEQRLRKIAVNISKDVKKFWVKIEKLVLYKHQLELEERKKKTLDKQLDFLLGQTERYSTMLAENLIDMPFPQKKVHIEATSERQSDANGERDEKGLKGSTKQPESQSDNVDTDGEYGIQSEDESEDDEHTIEEDEALVTEEERKEELAALQDEMDLPLEELLKRYANNSVSREESPESSEDVAEPTERVKSKTQSKLGVRVAPFLKRTQVKLSERKSDCSDSSGELSDSVEQFNGSRLLENSSDGDSVPSGEENHPVEYKTRGDKVSADIQHYREGNGELSKLEDQILEAQKYGSKVSPKACQTLDEEYLPFDSGDEPDDKDYVLGTGEDKDDETTLSEEEELTKKEGNDPIDEIKLLHEESEMPVEELVKRYKEDAYTDEESQTESDSASTSSGDQMDCSQQDIKLEKGIVPMDDYAVGQDEQCKVKEDMPVTKETEVKLGNELEQGREGENIIADAAAAARSAQPTGNTFSTTKVRTKFPFLLKFPLREYQHIGLDWLVTMYEKRLNGILADEMGLGKTIMTIALLAHLACEKGIWGPHLIVVPTSVMLNWETEFLKWCPAFKILTYFGSAKERRFKRQGWLKPNFFHVCITTYRLVIQDAKVFKRKKWKYLILDEAHLIKNWKSQRWQTLLNFNSKRRILLTGTPLQNDLMELWSLMHFLMPHIFQSHQEFKDWFSNPISGMVEGQEKVNKEVVDRLHNVLRPFILRRLKRDVEKQLPQKHEHVIYCRLSKRQRNLYEDFIASSETQATLASANFFGMISVIMQLRKVCNHPDLFEGRPIISSFDMVGIDMQLSSSICMMLSSSPFSKVDLSGLSLLFTNLDFSMLSWEVNELAAIATPSSLIEEAYCSETIDKVGIHHKAHEYRKKAHGTNIFEEIQKALWVERIKEVRERAASISWWNSLQCRKKPVYGINLRELVTIKHPVFDIHQQKRNPSCYLDFSSKLADIILLPLERFQMMLELIESFMFAIPAARAPPPVCWCSRTGSPVYLHPSHKENCVEVFAPLLSPIRPAIVRRQVYFPDRRLIQFDCGKLQELAVLLRRLKSEGHRALIFTQMTKMLDVLEAFISLYGYTYMRLDGSTQPEERQTLMQRFNTNPKFFLFILSTRSGGVGINLVGADTVIFYDSDWNPAMDQQAQDRCHRIGQTREVHIYRLISESTIEENILKKAKQKRALDDLVIQSGSYNTEFFKKLDPLELFSGHRTLPIENLQKGSSTVNENPDIGMEVMLSNADVEAALKHVEDEADYMALKRVEQEEAVENQEFTEEAIGRLEDDEYGNDNDVNPDEKTTEEHTAIVNKDTNAFSNGVNMNEERALILSTRGEDADVLADVKQMAAAAAAAGQASSSFENQLRPIDRYAMRFLAEWDPIIDKSAIESQVTFEEAEWELDRIEKFKDDLEAEIDEDEEPLLYERWDADFATEAYRQQVEALAQRQLMEELESGAKETGDADEEKDGLSRNENDHKPKSKKKTKKTKFKSLKKGALASESKTIQKEPHVEAMPTDNKDLSPVVLSPDTLPTSPIPKKRKKPQAASEEERASRKSSTKLKKAREGSPVVDSGTSEKQHLAAKESKSAEGLLDLDVKPASRSKIGGKISITFMPVKRVLVIKPEKLKKKGNVWSRDCIPSPDPWSPQEDAILCAIVHEYSTHWSLVSDTLFGMTAGGFYRGRFRQPAHCCERYRELFFKYVLSTTTTEHPNNEKISSTGSGKALLKVTEEHVRMLLDLASELHDNDLLLQKHFTAVLSSVWRAKSRFDQRQSMSSRNSLHSIGSFLPITCQMHGKSRGENDRMKHLVLGQSSKLVGAVLNEVSREQQEESLLMSNREEAPIMEEKLDIKLEFQDYKSETEFAFPQVVDLSICGLDPLQSADEPLAAEVRPGSSLNVAENRLRTASNSCFEGESLGWASSAFPTCDVVRTRPGSKSQSLGKHKAAPDSIKPPKSKVPKTTEASEECTSVSKPVLSSSIAASSNTMPCLDLSPFVTDPEIDEKDPYSIDDVLLEMRSFESIPHEYDPDFLGGLELSRSFSKEIDDIG